MQKSTDYTYDIAIIGGGIVGLASAYKLQKSYPDLSIVVLKKKTDLQLIKQVEILELFILVCITAPVHSGQEIV